MTFSGVQYNLFPGMRPEIATLEIDLFWGDPRYNEQFFIAGRLASATVDSSNTPTTEIRPGMILAYDTSDDDWLVWAVGASATGRDVVKGVLLKTTSTLVDNTAEDTLAWIAIGGNVRSAALLENADGAYDINGNTNESAIRTSFAANSAFNLDDYYKVTN